MTTKRSKAKPSIKLPFWKQDGKLWYAERSDLEAAIRASGCSQENLKRKLGAGYSELQEALNGKRLEGWTVAHIEWGLTPDSPMYEHHAHSWPPTKPPSSS